MDGRGGGEGGNGRGGERRNRLSRRGGRLSRTGRSRDDASSPRLGRHEADLLFQRTPPAPDRERRRGDPESPGLRRPVLPLSPPRPESRPRSAQNEWKSAAIEEDHAQGRTNSGRLDASGVVAGSRDLR